MIRFLVILSFVFLSSSWVYSYSDSARFEAFLDSNIYSNDLSLKFKKQFLFKTSLIKKVKKSPYFKSKVFSGISNCYYRLGVLDSALYFTLKSKRIRESLEYKLPLATSYLQLSRIYLNLGELQFAKEFGVKGNHIQELLGNERALKIGYSYLGLIYQELLNCDSARFFYLKSNILCKQQNDLKNLNSNLNNLANLEYLEDNLDLAATYYKEAIRVAKKGGFSTGFISNTFNLGLLYQELNQLDSSKFYMKQAIDFVTEDDFSKIDLQYIYYEYARTLILLGTVDSSLMFLEKYDKLKDSLFNKDKLESIREFQVQYETEKTQKELVQEKLNSAELTISNSRRRQLIVGLVIGLCGLVAITLFIFWNQRKKRRISELEVEAKSQEIDGLIKEQEAKSYASLLEGQDAERKRIAQDLHDNLGATLNAVKMRFEMLDEQIDQMKKENREHFDKMFEMVSIASKDVSRISRDLATGKLNELGLKGALQDLMNAINASKSIEVDFFMSDEIDSLDIKIEKEIYALIQEMMSNALKHSKCNHIDLQLNLVDNELNIVCEDNGVGFDYEQAKGIGLGLHSLENRVTKLGGTIIFDTNIGRGTIIIVNLQSP